MLWIDPWGTGGLSRLIFYIFFIQVQNKGVLDLNLSKVSKGEDQEQSVGSFPLLQRVDESESDYIKLDLSLLYTNILNSVSKLMITAQWKVSTLRRWWCWNFSSLRPAWLMPCWLSIISLRNLNRTNNNMITLPIATKKTAITRRIKSLWTFLSVNAMIVNVFLGKIHVFLNVSCLFFKGEPICAY